MGHSNQLNNLVFLTIQSLVTKLNKNELIIVSADIFRATKQLFIPAIISYLCMF